MRAFVADHDDIAGNDLPPLDGSKGIFLAVKDLCRAPVGHALMPRHFEHTPFRREVAFENDKATGRLHGIRQRA